MNLKNLIKKQSIIKYYYLLLILINFGIIFWIYGFMNKYVYQTMLSNTDSFIEANTKNTNDINIPKFDAVMKKIMLKMENKQLGQIKNIFE